MSNSIITTKSNKAQRNSSIELLRIISMFLIVLCHFATHGGFNFGAQDLSVTRFWWSAIEMGGNFGVNVFVLISGYFLISDKSRIFNAKKALKFWGQVFFYSIVIYFVFVMIGAKDFTVGSLVKTLFPITFESWWFASTYFVLYIIHPFINLLLRKLDKAMFQLLLAVALILWCIIPTFTTLSYQSNSLLWFITLYSVSGYVRLYGLNPKFKAKHYLAMWFIFSVLRYLSCIALVFLGTKSSFAYSHTLFFYPQQSLLTFLSALALFMAFEKKDIGYRKWINIIASASFGVYLIHENSLIRPLLWEEIFKNASYQNTALLIPYSVAVAVAVYCVCTVIDLIRQQTFEKPFMIVVNRFTDLLLERFKKILRFFGNIVFGIEKE